MGSGTTGFESHGAAHLQLSTMVYFTVTSYTTINGADVWWTRIEKYVLLCT